LQGEPTEAMLGAMAIEPGARWCRIEQIRGGAAWLLLSLGATISAGCGHGATRAECEEIMRRSAEVELMAMNITDPELVKERIEAARAAKGELLLQKCIGKRITDSVMSCVRRAQTVEEFETCLQ